MPAPERGMAEVIVGMCWLQQAIETHVGVIARSQPGGPQLQAGAGLRAQSQALPFPRVEVSVQEFLNPKPLTFASNLVIKDPQLFINKVVKTVKTFSVLPPEWLNSQPIS